MSNLSTYSIDDTCFTWNHCLIKDCCLSRESTHPPTQIVPSDPNQLISNDCNQNAASHEIQRGHLYPIARQHSIDIKVHLQLALHICGFSSLKLQQDIGANYRTPWLTCIATIQPRCGKELRNGSRIPCIREGEGSELVFPVLPWHLPPSSRSSLPRHGALKSRPWYSGGNK